jgi:hypothetical protein
MEDIGDANESLLIMVGVDLGSLCMSKFLKYRTINAVYKTYHKVLLSAVLARAAMFLYVAHELMGNRDLKRRSQKSKANNCARIHYSNTRQDLIRLLDYNPIF